MRTRLFLPLVLMALAGCAAHDTQVNAFKIGSATSKNVFVDPSQFANRTVKLRLRNSSGDPSIDVSAIRSAMESGLRAAGYQIGEQNFGILIDVNLYFMNSVAQGRQRASNELGMLLGGVAGYEMAKRPGGMGPGSGALLGAVAGATLQEVLRANNEYDSYLVLSDVNVGVVKQENRKKDFFVIGGNRIEQRQEDNGTFESFAMRETVKVAVYAGDRRERRGQVMDAIQDRLARVLSNLL
ncbi:complement resistance protein TraT [Acidovorax sp. NCPPB 3859]|nr:MULTISPECIES: complement resistance protein TraT [unclassified Acidovorax]MDA8449028.1 complement resistance protein TraT [Acidovorax sp. GBBC 3297]MDA8458884.1 complement resistance protein TraT [Acidovorax sp. GBBC 3333]MDA8463784.1 complement resistance protein TraT [Acidovorax sp. GBBC 3332]MDA8468816.1 complement resistance protein TraT [Acidovorax sp. GBBC 3299]WCM80428.1 complement resistance protein TraT [Acidovorax sp. GBBC 712]